MLWTNIDESTLENSFLFFDHPLSNLADVD